MLFSTSGIHSIQRLLPIPNVAPGLTVSTIYLCKHTVHVAFSIDRCWPDIKFMSAKDRSTPGMTDGRCAAVAAFVSDEQDHIKHLASDFSEFPLAMTLNLVLEFLVSCSIIDASVACRQHPQAASFY